MGERAPNHLRAWRKFRRLTQQELAYSVGTAKSVISDLERGVVQLSDKWLRKLAPVLQTQPGHLLDYDPDELDTDIIDIWSHIDAKDRDQAAAVLRTFANKTGTNN
jgi:transcriptional regulator with XRE-family HTH domain